jgi:hypothetical protein
VSPESVITVTSVTLPVSSESPPPPVAAAAEAASEAVVSVLAGDLKGAQAEAKQLKRVVEQAVPPTANRRKWILAAAGVAGVTLVLAAAVVGLYRWRAAASSSSTASGASRHTSAAPSASRR